MKIKQGDKVVVVAGRDKGKEGVVIKTVRPSGKLIVEGVNTLKKHVKGEQGGILDVTHPIDVSNVSLIDPKTNKPTRVGYELKGDTKVRVARPSGNAID